MHNYIIFTQIYVLQEFREKKQKSKKKQQIILKMKAVADLAMVGSNHYCDKAKNCHNKEMSKWPEDCRNNRFYVATNLSRQWKFCHYNHTKAIC